MQANQVSQIAFLEQISNWQLTMQRQSKKLKQLRKISKNKFQLNSIDIALIEIQSELIQYKKIRDRKYQDSITLIEDYTFLSKRFMNIMEKIAEAVEQDRFKETNTEVEERTKENENPNRSKHFMKETFTHKLSKEPSRKKGKSTITTKKQLTDLFKEGKTLQPKEKLSLKAKPNLLRLQMEEEQDLSDIRYQLKEIKSMMMQIENEIKFHSHEQLQRQIGKLSHNSKKMNGQLKTLRQDNQFILARLQNIKDEINHERQVQAQMIKQFQLGKDSRALINELSKSKEITDEVSDWVKVRI